LIFHGFIQSGTTVEVIGGRVYESSNAGDTANEAARSSPMMKQLCSLAEELRSYVSDNIRRTCGFMDAVWAAGAFWHEAKCHSKQLLYLFRLFRWKYAGAFIIYHCCSCKKRTKISTSFCFFSPKYLSPGGTWIL